MWLSWCCDQCLDYNPKVLLWVLLVLLEKEELFQRHGNLNVEEKPTEVRMPSFASQGCLAQQKSLVPAISGSFLFRGTGRSVLENIDKRKGWC